MLIISILSAAIAFGTALLFACLGEIVCERAGVLNLGVEGMMLLGALGGVATAYWTGSAWLGALGAMLVGGLLSTIHGLLAISLRANQVVSGLALTIFGTGLSSFLGQPFVGQVPPPAFSKLPVPLLSELPVLGPILFRQDALTYVSFAVVPLLWLWLFRTRPGLNLRAVGENPATADAMGVGVVHTRYAAVFVGGMLAGLGGAAISLATNPGWTDNITAGRGWIAVALVIFARWDPRWAAAGAYLFGGVEALLFRLQIAGTPVPAPVLSMLPYLLTVLVLVLASLPAALGSGRRAVAAPAALGYPYEREQRA